MLKDHIKLLNGNFVDVYSGKIDHVMEAGDEIVGFWKVKMILKYSTININYWSVCMFHEAASNLLWFCLNHLYLITIRCLKFNFWNSFLLNDLHFCILY